MFSDWVCSPMPGPPPASLPLSSFAPTLIPALSPPAPPMGQCCSRADAFCAGVSFEVLHISVRWSNIEIRGDGGGWVGGGEVFSYKGPGASASARARRAGKETNSIGYNLKNIKRQIIKDIDHIKPKPCRERRRRWSHGRC